EPVEHPVAAGTSEVVMVLHPRALVARGLARQLDRRDALLVEQTFECAIHGGHPQPRRHRARLADDLRWPPRASRVLEHAVDRLALRRGSFHEDSFSVGSGLSRLVWTVCGRDRAMFAEPGAFWQLEKTGGERGIRTLEAVLAPTRFPIVLLQ